jgi:hypothetical protein
MVSNKVNDKKSILKIDKKSIKNQFWAVKIVHSDSAEVWPNQSESIRWCCRIKSESW